MAHLEISDLHAGYSRGTVVRGVSMSVAPGQVVLLLGPNGAGKTTFLRAISGLCNVSAGEVRLGAQNLRGKRPHEIARLGIGHVPEGRQLFPDMSVWENLALGLQGRDSRSLRQERIEHVLELFPALRSRTKQRTGTLSGGEQQMLAIGRALMAEPAMLLLDEPSTGLAPVVFETVIDRVEGIAKTNTGVVLVEQSIPRSLSTSTTAHILRDGKFVWQGVLTDIHSHEMAGHYLGASEGEST